MWNEDSIRAVDGAWFDAGRGLRRPLVGTYSFDRFPGLIRRALTGDGAADADLIGPLAGRYDRVLFIFLDAFGWRYFEPALERSSFLQRVQRDGVIAKLTAQFPSTTTAHITTLHFGLPVGRSGIYEWFCYEPRLDRLIAPLLFSFAEDAEPNTLLEEPTLPLEAYAPGRSLFAELADAGVRSYVAQSRQIFGSAASKVTYAGAKWLPFPDTRAGLKLLAGAMQAEPGPAYFFFYYELIDKILHKAGPRSRKVEKQVNTVLAQIETYLMPTLDALPGRTLLLISADHGQVEISPRTVTYLNEVIPGLEPLIRRGAGGRPLVPAGSARDLFLHIQPDRLDEAYTLLTESPHVQGRAQVYRMTELIDAGLFGPVSDEFRRRVGDLVVLPEPGLGMWWRDPALYRRHTQNFRGHHGGLTPAEMDIPLLALAVG